MPILDYLLSRFDTPKKNRKTPGDVNLPDEKKGKLLGTTPRGDKIIGGEDLDPRWEEMATRRQDKIKKDSEDTIDASSPRYRGRRSQHLKPTKRTG
jgi:hypothetical protein